MTVASCYVLAKNEAPNIGRTVASALALGISVTVLDSGSSDGTPELARKAGATVEAYSYRGHAEAYNEVSIRRTPAGQASLALDADMRVPAPLLEEALKLFDEGAAVVRAPVEMHWSGYPLAHGSLCPPKAFLLRGGAAYFEPVGHGERLAAGVAVATTRLALIHDDRKPFEDYLLTQARYASALRRHAERSELNWRDRIRTRSPLGILASPFVSYFWRAGFRAGRVGWLYAIDRLIAEAVMYRQQVAAKLDQDGER